MASKEESALLRLLTPLAKLTTGKRAVQTSSEVVEIFGGAGYVEDTGIPRLLRDGQVFSIWEGTTNVLSLDVLRAIEKEGALTAAFQDFEKRLSQIQNQKHKISLEKALKSLKSSAHQANLKGPEFMQTSARAFSFFIADIFSGFLLSEFSQLTQSPEDVFMADRWALEKLSSSELALVEIINRESPQKFDFASI